MLVLALLVHFGCANPIRLIHQGSALTVPRGQVWRVDELSVDRASMLAVVGVKSTTLLPLPIRTPLILLEGETLRPTHGRLRLVGFAFGNGCLADLLFGATP